MNGTQRGNLGRAREIAQVAARYGFGQLLGSAGRRVRRAEPGSDDSRGRRLREMLDELGPTFVKFGQLLSTRADLVPPDILVELRKLQDRARPIPFEEIEAVVVQALGGPIEQAFSRFDVEPLAAASIGQVHTAALLDGREVVVKVQRPAAERQLDADIGLLYQLAKTARDRVSRLGFIDAVGIVDEFARTVRSELDYRIEARNLEVAGRNFRGHDGIIIPGVVRELTTERMLTMERVGGTPLARFDLTTLSHEERHTLAARIAEAWLCMVFEHGFFHADPHPANIVVQSATRIAIVDFGMVGQLMPGDRGAAVKLFVDVVNRDSQNLPRRLREMGLRYPRALESEFREELGAIIARYHGATLGQIDGRDLLREIFGTVHRLGITLPARWAMLDKTIATLAGVGFDVSPDFNVFEAARPHARRLLTSRVRPDQLAARLGGRLGSYSEALADVPLQIGEILQEIRDGEVRFGVDAAGTKEARERSEATGNRAVVAVLAMAMLIASTLIGVFAPSGPTLLGLRVIAFPGLALGLALAAFAMAGVLRSGRW